MEALLLDLDGVFYQGNQPIQGADKIAQWINENNIPHLFLTNTTSVPRSSILKKLQDFRIHTGEDHLLTPPVAAVNWMKQHGVQNIRLLVSAATQTEFSSFTVCNDAEHVDAVVMGDLGEQWTYQLLNDSFRCLMQTPKPHLVTLGMTRYWQAEDGLRLDVAPFVQALSYASNSEPVVMGKPDRHFYATALAMLKSEPANTLMIGDDIRGDIEGAQRAGFCAALVRTGKFREFDLQSGISPDYLLDTINDLPELWSSF